MVKTNRLNLVESIKCYLVDYDFHQSHVKTPVTGNYYDYNALIWTINRAKVGITPVPIVDKTDTYF